MMVSCVCLSSSKKKNLPPLFPLEGKRGERPQQNFCLDVEGFPPNTAPSQPVSIGSNIDIYLPTVAVISGPTATILKNYFEGAGEEVPTTAPHRAVSLPWGFLSK